MSVMVGVGPRRAGGRADQESRSDRADGESATRSWSTKPARSQKASPRVTAIVSADSISEDGIAAPPRRWSKTASIRSPRAIVDGARERGVRPPAVVDFQSTTGGGVIGRVDGRRVLVGKPAFLRGATALPRLRRARSKSSPLQHRGNTVVFVAVDDRAAGIIAVADPIKESTPGSDRTPAQARLEDHHVDRRQRAHRAGRGDKARDRRSRSGGRTAAQK